MRHLVLVAMLLLTFAVSCRRETPDQDMVAALETTATTDTAGTLSATTTGSTGGSVTAMTPADREFVAQAGMIDLAELHLSEIGVKRASGREVRSFAQRMVADHGRSNEELKVLATNKGLALPTAPDPDHQQVLERLQGLSGVAFDRDYMTRMVEDHQKAVSLFEEAERSVQDGDVRTFVTKTLPVLREHLDQARAIQSKLR